MYNLDMMVGYHDGSRWVTVPPMGHGGSRWIQTGFSLGVSPNGNCGYRPVHSFDECIVDPWIVNHSFLPVPTYSKSKGPPVATAAVSKYVRSGLPGAPVMSAM